MGYHTGQEPEKIPCHGVESVDEAGLYGSGSPLQWILALAWIPSPRSIDKKKKNVTMLCW